MIYTPEQQAEHRKVLVAALRSGKYIQTAHTLRDDKGFCCLGVACDLAKEAVGQDWVGAILRQDSGYEFGDDGEVNSLTPDVAAYYGFRTYRGGHTNEQGQYVTLDELNDEQGLPFDEIADVIESEPEGMFA